MRTSRDYDSPSFSSTLLDQIYRSIDEGETKSNETNFYRQQQTTSSFNKKPDTKHNNVIPRSNEQKLLVTKDKNRKSRRQQQRHHEIHDKDDVLFFSSTTSISSDSSSSVFSSSDTDSLSRASCFASQWPKPVRTSASFRFEKEKQATRVLDGGFSHNYNAKQSTENRGEEALLLKNKSRALKIYDNLKKVKQPISPGGKLTSFLNSLLFTTTSGNNVKKKSKGTCEDMKERKNVTCSSTRSCLSKTTSSSYRVNKTVRFVPVEEKESSRVVIKEAARKFLNEYRDNHKKKELTINHYDDDDDDDDVASCASSDLFELDHLDVLGDSRYCEDLPVYETTRISTNRAIANGLIV